MRLRIFMAAVAALTLSSTLAVADAARQAAQQCALKTHAPGNYNISNSPGVPHVILGQGGTTAGAARINDCLADAYQVQYGAKRGAVATVDTAPVSTQDALAECKRIRNQRIGGSIAAVVGFAAGLGDSFNTAVAIGGAAGIGVTARRETRRYGDCVAAAYTPPVDPEAAIFVGCSRQGGVMSQGTSLCVSP